MRVGIGLVVLCDLMVRSGSMVAHYTDEGVLPIKVLQEFYPKPGSFSFHNLSGSLWWQITLFVINALVALLLATGYRTRLASVLCWVFMVSLHNHNPFINQSGDDLLRMVLFFGIFLPWGNFYSIDARKTAFSKAKYFSLSAFGYMLLVGSVYFFSALYKTSPEWRTEGSAIYYALSLDQIKLGLGHYLYQFPLLMKVLTHFVFILEIVAPLLIFIPNRTGRFRSMAAALIILLHIGICLNLYVGFFYIIGITSAFGLLASKQMDWIEKRILKVKTVAVNGFFHHDLLYGKLLSYFNTLLLTFVISVTLLSNLSYIRNFPFLMSDKIAIVGNFLRLEQFWGMFSPNILKDDGWFVYKGLKTDGDTWDLYYNRSGINKNKPNRVVDMYESDRWRKFAENYQKNEYNFMRPYFCKYLIKKWNREHPDNKIDGLDIFFFKEVSLPDYKTAPIEELNVCLCYEKY